jgi:altronate dehydratase
MAQAENNPNSELAKVPSDEDALRQYVSPLVSMEHQVGTHVINALQQAQTVAVLTTVVPGPGGHEAIVSVGLSAERLEQVHELLEQAQETDVARVPCVGFHCFQPPRDEKSDAT